MEPLLHDGYIVYYRSVSFEDIKINDLILVRKKERGYVHRVIYKAAWRSTILHGALGKPEEFINQPVDLQEELAQLLRMLIEKIF